MPHSLIGLLRSSSTEIVVLALLLIPGLLPLPERRFLGTFGFLRFDRSRTLHYPLLSSAATTWILKLDMVEVCLCEHCKHVYDPLDQSL